MTGEFEEGCENTGKVGSKYSMQTREKGKKGFIKKTTPSVTGS